MNITSSYQAIEIIEELEGCEGATFEDKVEAFQFLIDTGVVWSLQGSYGRSAETLINGGYCTARPVTGARTVVKTQPKSGHYRDGHREYA